VRIIGGRWRGRLLPVASFPGVRPTPDSLRETLFNWLHPQMPGASCLDAFAGSGALGFESLSRGAAHVTMIEMQRPVRLALHRAAVVLEASSISILAGDARRMVCRGRLPGVPFDLVFLDPPFRMPLTDVFLASLRPLMSPEALVYIESSRHGHHVARVPRGWCVARTACAGEALGRLCRVEH